MSKIGFVVDSTFAINEAYLKEHQIESIPLTVFIDGKPYLDGEIKRETVVESFLEDRDFKTSQPTPEAFLKAYETQLKKFDEVVCLVLGKSLSGTFNSATLAKDMLEDPSKVTVINTQATSGGGLYITEKLMKLASEGKSVNELVKASEPMVSKGTYFITVDDLKYLIKGGRISRTKAIIGNLLKKKPILKYKDDVLGLDTTVRSFIGVRDFLVEQAKHMLESTKDKVTVLISYVDDLDRANSVKAKIEELGNRVIVRVVGMVSPVVSAHVGLGALGIYYTTA
jgi:DegV family protein with EDD domain